MVIDANETAVCETDRGPKIVKLLIEAFVADKFTIDAVFMQALRKDTLIADTFTIETVLMQALTNETFSSLFLTNPKSFKTVGKFDVVV